MAKKRPDRVNPNNLNPFTVDPRNPRHISQPDPLDAKLFGDYDGTNLDKVLNGLTGHNLENALPLATGLDKILQGYGSVSSAERTDMLLQYILQMLGINDQRTWDKKMLDEQRLYDNPQNVLARLMGAGISRDAAIQLLNSVSGGSGGSALVGSGSGISAPSTSGISGTHDLQTLDSVMGCLQVVGSLVSAGFSITNSFAQYQMLKNQNYLTTQQRNAFDAASTAFSILSSSGVELNEENFGSISNVSKSLEQLKDTNEAAAQFIKAGGLEQLRKTAPYSSPFLNQLYRNERDSRDYNRSFAAQVGLIEAQQDLAQSNQKNVEKQIEVFAEQINLLRSQSDYTDKIAGLVEFQKTYLKAQTRQVNASSYATELENKQTESFINSTINGESGLKLYTDYKLNNYFGAVRRLSYLNTNESWLKEANSFLAEQDHLVAMYELATLYERGEITQLNSNDEDINDLLYFCSAAEKCHLFEYVRTIADVNSKSKWSIPGFSGTEPTQVPGIDLIYQHTNKNKFNWKPFGN